MRALVLTIHAVMIVAAAPSLAHAQYNVPTQASGSSRSDSVEIADDEDGDRRREMIAQPEGPTPIGWELGASLDFMTSEPSLGGEKLKFTDLVMFRVHALVAIGRKTELFGGADLLPKQPSFTDEHKWQGALAGVRTRVTNSTSFYVRGQFGPNLDHDGFWVIGEAAGQYRKHLAEKALFWESTIGATHTQLLPDDNSDPLYLTELLTQTGIAIRDRKGLFATWVNFSFHFPISASPSAQQVDRLPFGVTQSAIDPQVRVGMYMGMLVGVNKGLDLFVEASILDRGDLADATTTLPMLSGGFDQRRILFGFNRRFGKRRR